MFDPILRGAAIGAMALIVLILLRDRRNGETWSAAASFLCVLCYLVVSAPTGEAMALRPVLIAGATLAPVALTWMAVQHLTDDPPQRRPLLALAALTVLAAIGTVVSPMMETARGVLAVALYFGLILLALLTDKDDLVTARRRFRRGFLVAMGSLGLVVSLFEASGLDADLPAWVYPLQAGAILTLSLLFGLWALSVSLEQPPSAKSGLKARNILADKVDQAMADEIWKREGLTIGMMAEQLGVPEHQLRATINGAMGHRNFSTFINTARINAAKTMLDDPEQARTTILAIAHEVGFGSLGPFNKAFRVQTGASPRDYRRKS